MKRNIYYSTVFRRNNPIKQFIYGLFTMCVSSTRLLLEVHSRKNFGERYFSFSMAVIYAFFLSLAPFAKTAFSFIGNPYEEFSWWDFILHNLSWYAFLALFLYRSYERWKEVQRPKSSFDFSRYSLSTGEIDPRIREFKFKGKRLDIRTIETVVEPAFFFLCGLGLAILAQPVGLLIMLCSVCYSFSYRLAYQEGDDFILNMIDNMIANEQTTSVFINGMESKDTKGYQMRCVRPSNERQKQELVEEITEIAPAVYAI